MAAPDTAPGGPLAAVAAGGLTLLGCGKMGSALLQGWLAAGVPAASVSVIEPSDSPDLARFRAAGVRTGAPARAAALVLAVKPQMMAAALPAVAHLAGPATLVMSIAAGTPMSFFERALGAGVPIVRAMPNTPAAVGRGVTALTANAAGAALLPLAEALAGAVGRTVRVDSEAQIDAVTAVSGSGPAYVFALIEAMAAAGEAEGLSPDVAMALARATICGAGELAHRSAETAADLRRAVTSPGGTTAAALAVLQRADDGLDQLMRRAVAAAAARARELGG